MCVCPCLAEKNVCVGPSQVRHPTHTCINRHVSLSIALLYQPHVLPNAVSAENSCSLLESDPPPGWEVQEVLKKSSDNGLLSTALNVTEGSISPCLTGLSQILFFFSMPLIVLISFLIVTHFHIQKFIRRGVLSRPILPCCALKKITRNPHFCTGKNKTTKKPQH